MKIFTLATVLFLCHPVSAAEAERKIEMKGFVSAWTQDCSGQSCGLPVPGERNRPVEASLVLPQEPGEAAAAHVPLKLTLADGSEFPAELDFYAVCPYGGPDCAGRYFQAQVSVDGGKAFCASSLNLQDFAPFPVTMCAASSGGLRRGITLHREPL